MVHAEDVLSHEPAAAVPPTRVVHARATQLEPRVAPRHTTVRPLCDGLTRIDLGGLGRPRSCSWPKGAWIADRLDAPTWGAMAMTVGAARSAHARPVRTQRFTATRATRHRPVSQLRHCPDYSH